MVLSIYQKSIYLIVFNATMISRSIGKTLKENGFSDKKERNKEMNEFRKLLFKEIGDLTALMDNKQLKEGEIINSINILSKKFGVSFGQAQKGVNVILKFHYHLNKINNENIKKGLHCPIDSLILKEVLHKKTSLTSIDRDKYLAIQNEIKKKAPSKVDFDKIWDIKNLKDAGIS